MKYLDLQTWIANDKPLNSYIHCDCMDLMDELPEDWHENILAVCDPPYGIGRDEGMSGKNWKSYQSKNWDKKRPSKKYFDKLFQISKNQIIWGGNYFVEYLKPSMGWIFWDKGQILKMSDGELAFTNFQKALRRIIINRCKIYQNDLLIHPTQKPVALYRWLLQNYAKPGDIILDTHTGSASSLIACHEEGYPFIACEKDIDYYNDSLKRLNEHIRQGKLF